MFLFVMGNLHLALGKVDVPECRYLAHGVSYTFSFEEIGCYHSGFMISKPIKKKQ